MTEEASGERVAQLVDALHRNDPGFQATWEWRRHFKDDSASSYDMAVANAAVEAGFSDPDIRGLMRAWRTKHDAEPGKIDRNGYVAGTISKARAGHNANAA